MLYSNSARQNLLSDRIESIDVLRGLTILFMIFVNDMASVADVPYWLKHMPTRSDGMTVVDLVFPAFLFIVGMSMPFSVGKRLENESALLTTWKHILNRTFGLLIIGFFMVNSYEISKKGDINPHIWICLMYIFVMVIWNKGSIKNNHNIYKYIKGAAIAGLILLVFLYTGKNQTGWIQMRPHWWGILGLIGWAYLVSCIFYIPFRKSEIGILGSIILLYCFYMAEEAGLLAKFSFIRDFMHPSYTLGSHSAIILSGTLLGSIISKKSKSLDHRFILKWSLIFSLGFFICGLFLHKLNEIHIMFIISKNLGTVPWCMISTAFTIWIWMFIYLIIDVKGFRQWTRIIKPAGANPLFAYLLAPFVIECFACSAIVFGGFNPYNWLGETFIIGLLRASILAFSMTWLAGYLGKKDLLLKL